MFTARTRRLALALASAAAVAGAGSGVVQAQGTFAYPNAGQSSQKQAQDSMECQGWATGQTGFRPGEPMYVDQGYSQPPPPQSSGGLFGQGSYGQGGMLADAGKGAGIGALGGAIAGDAGKGAAIGALSGVFIGGIKRSNQQAEYEQWQRQQAHQQQQAQQQAQYQYQQRQSAWNRAYGTCMAARNYTVQ